MSEQVIQTQMGAYYNITWESSWAFKQLHDQQSFWLVKKLLIEWWTSEGIHSRGEEFPT